MSKGWAYLAELSYKYWSLQLSQLLYTLLKKAESKNPFQSILGNKILSPILFPTITLSILGKPEPKEKEDSLEHTSRATALRPHQSPNQGRTQRCRGRCLTAPNYRGQRVAAPQHTASSIFPIKITIFKAWFKEKAVWAPGHLIQDRSHPGWTHSYTTHTQLYQCHQPGRLSFFSLPYPLAVVCIRVLP